MLLTHGKNCHSVAGTNKFASGFHASKLDFPLWKAVQHCAPSINKMPCNVDRLCKRMQVRLCASYNEDEAAGDEDVDDAHSDSLPSIVGIKVVKDLPRFDMPLLLGSIQSINRVAVAVEYRGENFLLTTASNVVYSSEIKISLSTGNDDEEPQTYKATVEHLAMEADLAVLRVTGSGTSVARRRPGLRRSSSSVGTGGSAGEEGFWSRVQPLELGEMPKLQDVVQLTTSSGAGSDSEHHTSASTAARVTCIEVMRYPLASYRLLGLRLSAAVAKEQVGCPVLDRHGSLVGLVFQRVKGAGAGKRRRGGRSKRGDDEVTAVPVDVIRHVLDGIVDNGKYMGFSLLGIKYKPTDAAALRQYLGMSHDKTGILVLEVNPTSAAAAPLEVMQQHISRLESSTPAHHEEDDRQHTWLLPGDVIMSLNGQTMGNDGTLPYEHGGRIAITHKVAQLPVGSTAEVAVMRNRQQCNLSLRFNVPHRLLPTHLAGKPPSYLVIGGLVLTVLSVPYLEQCFGSDNQWMRTAPPRLLSQGQALPRDQDHHVVVVAHCSDSQGLDGYKPELIEHQQIVSFYAGPGQPRPCSSSGDSVPSTDASASGPCMQPLHNLSQLAQAVLACREGSIWLELGDGSMIVQAVAQANADARALIAEYEVTEVVSKDLSHLLPRKASAPRLSLTSGAGSRR